MIKRARPKGSRHHHKSLNHQKGLATRWRPSELLGLRPTFGRPTARHHRCNVSRTNDPIQIVSKLGIWPVKIIGSEHFLISTDRLTTSEHKKFFDLETAN